MTLAPIYQAHGSRILNRTGSPVWLSVEEARQTLASHIDLAIQTDRPDIHLRAAQELVWAIRDAEAEPVTVTLAARPTSFFPAACEIAGQDGRAA